jgi:maleamate amidohydrolase
MADMSEFEGFAGKVGWGEKPALLVIDMCVGFTSSESPLVCESDSVSDAIAQLLEAARAAEIPVVYTTVSYGEYEKRTNKILLMKMPGGLICEAGTKWVEIDPRVAPLPSEPVFSKVVPSAFFGSTLSSLLRGEGVDTVIVTGVSTSGCVRATVVDACSSGFRPIVPREAVGDRIDSAHEATLFDIDFKYGDVVSLEDALAELRARTQGVGAGVGAGDGE